MVRQLVVAEFEEYATTPGIEAVAPAKLPVGRRIRGRTGAVCTWPVIEFTGLKRGSASAVHR